jgi:chemotaxis protein MotA
MNVFEKRMNKKGNEFDALVIGLIATFIFYGVLWVIFSLGLGNPYHRIFILLGGSWPEGTIQFFTFFAFFWALLMLGSKTRRLKWENNALSLELLPEDEYKVLLPDKINDLRLKLADIQEWQDSIMIKTLKMACTKFRANKSVQETMDVVNIQTEINLNYLDTSFSIIRYLAWSIPSIGFIGTVMGISGALGHVDQAAAGDLSAVTSLLGTAFDTTLIALLLSILLMFRIHRVQQIEEHFIISVQDYLMSNFVNRIYVPKAER